MEHSEHLRMTLPQLGLPQEAVDFLVDLWDGIQVLDDALDGDHPKTPAGKMSIVEATFGLLVRMPSNPFYLQCQSSLLPIIAMQIMKWQAANEAEDEMQADARSFMWRAGYYEVVAMACSLCNKPESIPLALKMYAERLEDYLAEFGSAKQTERVQ